MTGERVTGGPVTAPGGGAAKPPGGAQASGDAIPGPDGRRRCSWGLSAPEYIAYHDREWGRPVGDEVRIFEKLCLEGFQSGLSWITILRKREAFRAAFSGFDPLKVAGFAERDVQRLLTDAGIVRHRGKIEATIANARATVALTEAGESLAGLVWSHAPGRHTAAGAARADAAAGAARRTKAPRQLADIPASTDESAALSKALRRRGFRFVGPTTVYAAMQSLGLVNDHLAGCWCRAEVEAERKAFAPPA